MANTYVSSAKSDEEWRHEQSGAKWSGATQRKARATQRKARAKAGELNAASSYTRGGAGRLELLAGREERGRGYYPGGRSKARVFGLHARNKRVAAALALPCGKVLLPPPLR